MPSHLAGKLAISAIVVALAVAALPLSHWESDFLSFYAGARLAGTPELFSFSAVHKIEAPLERRPDELRAWIRPPFYALLLSPLGRLPYRAAACVWQVLLALALISFVWLWDDRLQSYLLSVLFVPTLITLMLGQDVALLLLFAGIALKLEERGKPFAGGLVLALCAIKVHVFLLVPLWIVSKRLWRLGLGLCAGGGILTAICFWMMGPGWVSRYREVLATNELHQASQDYMVSLMGLLHSAPPVVWWLASLLVAAGCFFAQSRLGKREAFAVALFGGLLIAPHAFLYDLAFLLPALTNRRTAAVGLGAVWFLISVPALAVLARLFLVGLFVWILYGCLGPAVNLQTRLRPRYQPVNGEGG